MARVALPRRIVAHDTRVVTCGEGRIGMWTLLPGGDVIGGPQRGRLRMAYRALPPGHLAGCADVILTMTAETRHHQRPLGALRTVRHAQVTRCTRHDDVSTVPE